MSVAAPALAYPIILPFFNPPAEYRFQEDHATFFAHFLQHLWEDLKGRRQVEALAEIDSEYENVRVAWQGLVEKQRARELGEAASSLWFYLETSARYYEGVELFDQAVEALRSVARSSEENWVIGHLLGRLAWFQGGIGLTEKCKATAHEALSILRSAHRPEETVMALHSIGHWSHHFVQHAEFQKASEETIRIAEEMDNAWVRRIAWASRGSAFYWGGNVAEGRRMLEESLNVSLIAGDLWMVAHSCNALAWDTLNQRSFQETERFARQFLQAFETLHLRSGISEACIWLGASLAQQGHAAEAKSYLHRGIKINYDMGVPWVTLVRILTIIEVYFSAAHQTFAVELLAMILNNPACDNTITDWTEKTIVVLKAELSPEDYEMAWQRGTQCCLDQAVALVLTRLS